MSIYKYLSRKAIAGQGATHVSASSQYDVRELEFFWIWLKNGDQDEAYISKAIEMGVECGAMVSDIFPPIFTFWFNVLPHETLPDGARLPLVAKIAQHFKEGGKGIHGRVMVRIGNHGSATRFVFGPIAISQARLLEELFYLPFGEYRASLP